MVLSKEGPASTGPKDDTTKDCTLNTTAAFEAQAPLIHVTFFPDEYAKSMSAMDVTLFDLRNLILTTSAKAKDDLQWLKLAWFGNRPSDKNCLRNNANMDALSGAVGEHDKSTMTFDEAISRLRAARVTALVYTSPSHTEAKPRWRVVAPTSKRCSPDLHRGLMARINGILGGVLSLESFTLSQSYYFGKIDGAPDHRIEMTFGECIDLRDDLDETAIYPNSNSLISNLQLTDVAGVKTDVPIASLSDERLKTLDPAALYMIEHAKAPDNASDKVRKLKGGNGHCYVVGSLVRAGLNNEQIKDVYRLGKIADGPRRHPRRFDGYVERVIAYCRSKQQDKKSRDTGVSLNDFRAYMLMNNYIYMPTRDPWPKTSVNARLGKVQLVDANGQPVLNDAGEPEKISASLWLDRNKSVEQMTWAPGLPELITNRLIADGGWIHRSNVTCLNLYRPPTIISGDAAAAKPWVDHLHRIYPNDAEHIQCWLAQRVQYPEVKINHILVLGGDPGIGKDTLLGPVRQAVGEWNFGEISPKEVMGDFNPFLRKVILRISEARDLGEINRYQFYEHTKTYAAAPPEMLQINEKYLHQYYIFNVVGVVITTNYKTDGIYLPHDDRRHYVAWSEAQREEFGPDYFDKLWSWYYKEDGNKHVAAYLRELDISLFNPKASPLKTAAFWDIVDANRAPEEGELADVLDHLGNPAAVTLDMIRASCAEHDIFDLADFLADIKNRRQIPHRLKSCQYVPVRNEGSVDHLWKVKGKRQVVYAKATLSLAEQLRAANELSRTTPAKVPIRGIHGTAA
jgi:hypothetical protein